MGKEKDAVTRHKLNCFEKSHKKAVYRLQRNLY